MATIYDVAKRAGVSHTAVSAVLNNKSTRVGDKTRERILRAAEELGYRTNRAAQQLATGKFGTILMCFERAYGGLFVNREANELMTGVEDAARENGQYLLFAPPRSEHEFDYTVSSFHMHGIDGGIIVGPIPLTDSAISIVNQCTIPLVCIDSYRGFATASTVDQDNEAGMRLGVERLISIGHRKLAYIAPPPMFQCLVERMTGFEKGVQNSGLSIDHQSTHLVEPHEVPDAVRGLLSSQDTPTAIISAHEQYTPAILKTADELGLRIPDDLDVMSYGDPYEPHPLIGRTYIIRYNRREMGMAAAGALKRLVDGECCGPISIRIPTQIIAPEFLDIARPS